LRKQQVRIFSPRRSSSKFAEYQPEKFIDSVTVFLRLLFQKTAASRLDNLQSPQLAEQFPPRRAERQIFAGPMTLP
jgi:hypothetical protein